MATLRPGDEGQVFEGEEPTVSSHTLEKSVAGKGKADLVHRCPMTDPYVCRGGVTHLKTLSARRNKIIRTIAGAP